MEEFGINTELASLFGNILYIHLNVITLIYVRITENFSFSKAYRGHLQKVTEHCQKTNVFFCLIIQITQKQQLEYKELRPESYFYFLFQGSKIPLCKLIIFQTAYLNISSQ